METKSKIILKRRSEWMNRMRGYKVLINDAQVGIIKNDTTEEYVTEPGLQLLKCKVDWCGSNIKELMLKPGEIAYVQVKSNLKYFSYFYILILAGLFGRIILKQNTIVLPQWVTITYAGLAGLAGLYLLYFLTLGRNNYLSVDVDKDNIFAK